MITNCFARKSKTLRIKNQIKLMKKNELSQNE